MIWRRTWTRTVAGNVMLARLSVFGIRKIPPNLPPTWRDAPPADGPRQRTSTHAGQLCPISHNVITLLRDSCNRQPRQFRRLAGYLVGRLLRSHGCAGLRRAVGHGLKGCNVAPFFGFYAIGRMRLRPILSRCDDGRLRDSCNRPARIGLNLVTRLVPPQRNGL